MSNQINREDINYSNLRKQLSTYGLGKRSESQTTTKDKRVFKDKLTTDSLPTFLARGDFHNVYKTSIKNRQVVLKRLHNERTQGRYGSSSDIINTIKESHAILKKLGFNTCSYLNDSLKIDPDIAMVFEFVPTSREPNDDDGIKLFQHFFSQLKHLNKHTLPDFRKTNIIVDNDIPRVIDFREIPYSKRHTDTQEFESILDSWEFSAKTLTTLGEIATNANIPDNYKTIITKLTKKTALSEAIIRDNLTINSSDEDAKETPPNI